MPAPTLTFGDTPMTAAEARAAGQSFEDIARAAFKLARTDDDIERRLLLWAADCAVRALHLYEGTERSKAPRDVITAVRRYARREIDISDLQAARAAAHAAAQDAAWDAAWAAAYAAARATEDPADAADFAARAAALAATPESLEAALAAEKRCQSDRFMAWFSDTEPQDWPLPALPKRRAA